MGSRRKSKHINVNIRALRDITRHRALLPVCTVILIFFSFFQVKSMCGFYSNTHGVTACLADVLVAIDAGYANAMGMRSYATIPVFMFMAVIVGTADYNPQNILRSGTRVNVWRYQCIKIGWLSLIIATLATAAALFAGVAQTDIAFNWNQENTVYWVAAGEVLGYELSVVSVAVMFFAVQLLTLLFSGTLLMLIRLALSNTLIGWVAVMGLCFIDGIYVNLFYARVSVNYSLWVYGYPVPAVILLAVSSVAVLFGVGLSLARRKEFL